MFHCGIFGLHSLSAPGGKNTLGSSRKNDPNLPPELGPRGTPKVGRQLSEGNAPAPKPALEEKAFENCVKKV